MLGRDVLRAGERAGHRRHRRCSAPSSTSPTRDALHRGDRRASARTRSSTAPPGPTSTAPRTHEAGRADRQRRRAPATSRRVRAGGRALRACLDRLRLRRHGDAAVRGERPGRADRRLRPHQARRRATRSRGAARRTPSCGPRGCSAPRARTSSTPCCAWPPTATRSRSSTTRSAARPGPATWRRALLALARGRVAARHLPRRRRRASARGTSFALEIFAQAGVECRVHRGSTAELGRPAPRPAWSRARHRARRRRGCRTGSEGLAGFLAERTAGARA